MNSSSTAHAIKGAAWAAHAGDLAAWAQARLTNRTDAWGAYTAAGGQVTVRGALTPALLARHFRGGARADLVGLHTAGPDNTSLGGAVDIDYHGAGGNDPEANRAAALHWFVRMADYGLTPLLYESNGRGGYHLRQLLARPADAGAVFHFLRRLTADHRDLGLAAAPERFPKQPDVRRCAKGLGNWLRLPGRHHSRPFWSRVWAGRWLEGEAAVAHLLALEGDDPTLLPPVPAAAVPAQPRNLGRKPGLCRCSHVSRRVAAFAARLPHLGEGQGRDNVGYHFAAFLVRDLALSDETALEWLLRWDCGNAPPKGEARLRQIVASARRYGRGPIGCGLAGGCRP